MPTFSLSKQKGEWYRPPLASVIDLQTHAVTITINGQAKKLPVTAFEKTRHIQERNFPQLGHKKHSLFFENSTDFKVNSRPSSKDLNIMGKELRSGSRDGVGSQASRT